MIKNKQNDKKFYNKIGSEIGWNFDDAHYVSVGIKWDFYQIVKENCKKNYRLLDIGTGGGEKILKIASKVKQVVGIDLSQEMIKVANKNLIKSKLQNTEFMVTDARKIPFPNDFFDIISCRHSDFSVCEVHRLLSKGGIFLTQQVSESDKHNLKNFYGRGQNISVKDRTAMERYCKCLKKAGFLNIKTYEYDAIEYYKTPKDLIFLLEHAPIIPNFGKYSADYQKLDNFIKQNTTKRGIKTNSKRYMIIAQK